MIRRLTVISLIIPVIGIFVILNNPAETSALNPSHVGCSTCHSLHSSPGQTLTSEASRETLCLSCHSPAGPGIEAAVHTNISGSSHAPFSITCTDCHNPHDSMQNYKGGINIKQVGAKTGSSNYARIKLPDSAGGGDADVLFEQRGSDADPPYNSTLRSFADGDEDGDLKYEGVCEVCHTAALNHRNDGTGNIVSHYVGQNCIDCHGHDVGFEGSGGGCTGCHSSGKDNGDGPPTRRAIISEFALTSHHASLNVTDGDCMVCHHEAKDDGSGGITTDAGYHKNNLVDLRNPDTNAVISFTQFSRNTASNVLEDWVTEVQNDFCLKCHDTNGALNETIPSQPFSSGNSPANVFDQFNSSDNNHAVLSTVNNPYCNSSTLVAPWNSGDLISCFDCHGISGHGGSNQRMLRVSIDFDSMEAAVIKGDLPSGLGANVEALCTLCHSSSVYVSGATGSAFEYHGTDQIQHSAVGSNELGCLGCHAGIKNLWVNKTTGAVLGNNGSARGNIHGFNFTWGSDSFADGSSAQMFLVGGWLSGWQLTSGTGYCGGGSCSHLQNTKDYTADIID